MVNPSLHPIDVETRQCDGCLNEKATCIRFFPGREKQVWVCKSCIDAGLEVYHRVYQISRLKEQIKRLEAGPSSEIPF